MECRKIEVPIEVGTTIDVCPLETHVVEVEALLREFYISGEPETTGNCPLKTTWPKLALNYHKKIGGQFQEYFVTTVEEAQPGEALMSENALVSCACVRDCAPYTRDLYTHAPKCVSKPPSPRIPPHVHQHLAKKFAATISSPTFSGREFLIGKLDSRHLTSSLFQGTSAECSKSITYGEASRGPWKAGKSRTVDLNRVWNIIANNAVCHKVRSKSEGQVETCEMWGLWLMQSFINHSCNPNCHRMLVGEAVVTRAARRLAAGEELSVPYFDIFDALHLRQLAAEGWGFRCQCNRCNFERSKGAPYDVIQEQIVNLKHQLHTAWNLTDKKLSDKVADRLLEKFCDLVPQVNAFLMAFRRKAWDQNNNQLKLKRTESESKRKLKARTHKAANREKFDPDDIQNPVEESWIKASFLEPFIAVYALREIESPCLGDLSLPLLPSCLGIDQTPEAMKLTRVMAVVEGILEIMSIYPGNMLGQEFYRILIQASQELLRIDLKENFAANKASLDAKFTEALHYFATYYGFPGVEVLGMLITAES